MVTSSTSLDIDTPLALLDLEIPGKTGPTPDGELGINHAAALDNFPRNGLQVFIPAWNSMGPGDSVQVLLGVDVVVSDTVDPSEVNQRLTLFIAPARFTNGPTTLQYKVTRFGAPPESSAELPAYVKLTLPGGEDMDEETPGHSELILEIAAEYVENGVDADQADAGVPVTIKAYPNMAEHDEIRLSWGGQFINRTVLNAEVDTDIEIVVDKATILAAGDSGTEGLAVTFEVYDLVDNRSEDWSAEIRLVVDTGNTRLLAPIIKEANNNVLDLDALGDNPITAQIVAMDSNFAVDDQIVVNLRGAAADGTPVSFTCPPKLITSVPSIPEVFVPNAQVRLLAQAQAIFSYRLIKKNGTPDLRSKGRFISVIGEVKRLLAPIAKDALQGALDPALPRTTVEIPWDDSMQEGQVIDLKWLGTYPNLSIYFPELTPHPITHGDAVARLPIPMVVSGIHLAAINGGTLELYYQLQSDVVTRMLVNRESLHAALLNVGEPRAELPAPTVDGELDGVLDPEDVPGGTTLTVPRYNGMASGDEVHCEWLGSITGKYEDLIKLNASTATRPVPFTISYELVADNLGGTVDASYFVNRVSGRVSPSDVLPMQIGEGGPVFGDESFEREPLGPLELNKQLPFANGLKVTVIGTVPGTSISDPQLNEFGGRALYCADGHKIKFEFGGGVTTVLLSHALTATANNKLEFFNSSNDSVRVINLKVIPAGSQVAYENVMLDAPCDYCELTVDVIGTMVDNLVWL